MKKPLEQDSGAMYVGNVNIVQKIIQLKNIEQWVKDALAEPLKSACGVLNWEAGVLTLHVTNSALATLLRYQLRELQKTLAVLPIFKMLTTIRYRIAVDLTPPLESSLPTPPISHAHGAVNACIENLEEGPLREALQRLAKHVER